jgi:hypothetical protein
MVTAMAVTSSTSATGLARAGQDPVLIAGTVFYVVVLLSRIARGCSAMR